MSFWQKIKLLTSGVWDFLWPFIKVFLGKMGAILATIALDTVTQLAKGNLSSSEKREEAFKQIESQLVSQGIQVGSSVIYSAIEAAVQKLKAANPS